MHVMVALSPICTVVFFGTLFCKMGRIRGLAVEKMMGVFLKEIRYITTPKCVSAAWCRTSAN